ncbi:antibiotic biosynthesis monooxygenase family protein [Sphingorhabdus sp. M41]|uniref:antibiotic biosynthesis monooxygenase family protein n=1 Tax=Sphingorhabdus sp. M41 TaxID=1806885 RepID=UPI00078DFC26|nr:antibiotic biosynthesis monooxygenase [Sphingorhabdus sp. M41]AMO72418.1 antibiotic biosynthesis monooxygenase [Sphingorhabdus sp. M41]
MQLHPNDSIAVIFCAQRCGSDDQAYQAAATAMGDLAAQQPGYLGEDHARSADGFGITVSYWQDDASAKAWRDHPDHTLIRERGRDKWYSAYSLHVTRVERGYDWQK